MTPQIFNLGVDLFYLEGLIIETGRIFAIKNCFSR